LVGWSLTSLFSTNTAMSEMRKSEGVTDEEREVNQQRKMMCDRRGERRVRDIASSSAAAERPREPLSQLKSCQLLHNCTKNHI